MDPLAFTAGTGRIETGLLWAGSSRRIPGGRDGSTARPADGTDGSPPSSAVVLVVDDDEAVRESLAFLLESEGFAVVLYEDGESILAAEDLPEWGCLLIDIVLPGLGGLDLVARLRTQGVGLPAILITGVVKASLAADARTAGVLLIEKPLLGPELVATVKAVTGRD